MLRVPQIVSWIFSFWIKLSKESPVARNKVYFVKEKYICFKNIEVVYKNFKLNPVVAEDENPEKKTSDKNIALMGHVD